MSPELIAVLAVGATMLGVVVAVAGLILSALSGIRADMSGIRSKLRDVHKDIGDLRKRLARLEALVRAFRPVAREEAGVTAQHSRLRPHRRAIPTTRPCTRPNSSGGAAV